MSIHHAAQIRDESSPNRQELGIENELQGSLSLQRLHAFRVVAAAKTSSPHLGHQWIDVPNPLSAIHQKGGIWVTLKNGNDLAEQGFHLRPFGQCRLNRVSG